MNNMRPTSRLPSMDNYRATFVRASDSKIFRGWVDGASEKMITIRSVSATKMVQGDTFFIEVYGPEIFRLTGKLSSLTSSSLPMLLQASSTTTVAIEATEEWYTFSITEYRQSSPNPEEPRIATDHVEAALYFPDGNVIEACEVTDISKTGLGLTTSEQLPMGKLEALVTCGPRRVRLEVHVLYSRKMSKVTNVFHTGLKISEFSERVNEITWNALRASFIAD